MYLLLVRYVRADSMNAPSSADAFGSQKCYASIVEDLNLSDIECLKYSLSKGLGVGIVVGGSIMKLPQLLLSMWSIRNISVASEANAFPSSVRPFRARNLSKLLHPRNLLLPRDVRIFLSQGVPIFDVRGERLPGVAEHRNHPSHHLLSLFHAAKIVIFLQ